MYNGYPERNLTQEEREESIKAQYEADRVRYEAHKLAADIGVRLATEDLTTEERCKLLGDKLKLEAY